jgi:hypothetical protein
MAQARLKVFGCGREGDGMTAEEEASALGSQRRRFGGADFPSEMHRPANPRVCRDDLIRVPQFCTVVVTISEMLT